MRAGPLSDPRVIAMLNRYFVPVFAVNEDYRESGNKPDEEKAEYQRIYREALGKGFSAGTVHAYMLDPDGHPIATLHVAEAAKPDRLIASLEQVVATLKTPEGAPLVKPTSLSAPPEVESD